MDKGERSHSVSDDSLMVNSRYAQSRLASDILLAASYEHRARAQGSQALCSSSPFGSVAATAATFASAPAGTAAHLQQSALGSWNGVRCSCGSSEHSSNECLRQLERPRLPAPPPPTPCSSPFATDLGAMVGAMPLSTLAVSSESPHRSLCTAALAGATSSTGLGHDGQSPVERSRQMDASQATEFSTFAGTDDEDEMQLEVSELALMDSLGSGAQAEVFRAVWWRKLGRSTSAITVAVKRLHDSCGQRAHACESLTRKIKHPNLVKCFEATVKPPYIIVSELCAGGSLYNRLRDRSMPSLAWRQRLKILLDVAKGMEYLHNRTPCILHRDLKSCNVLLVRPINSAADLPTAKVADFGLSRVLMSSQAWMTRCVGTWRWMAPEVFSRNDYDSKIDVFSFGILMFEVLSQEIPYADVWPVKAAVNPRIGLHIIKGHRPNIKLVQPGCPSRVLQLMQECWAGPPADRPAFTEVVERLECQLGLAMFYGDVTHDSAY